MNRNTGFLQFVIEEVLAECEGITNRGMFGGYGLYQNGIIFGMIIQDQLYFKVSDSTREEYIAKGSNPFMYQRKDKKLVSLGYYTVPEDIVENRQEIAGWVEKAVLASKSAKK